MNPSLDAMTAAGSDLLAALGRSDIATIDAAVRHYRDTIADVRANGAWHATPGLAQAAHDLLDNVERLTVRVRKLTQASSERLAALEAAGAPVRYARPETLASKLARGLL